jgi:C_GCAxxG_C_C family probable redox protein
MEKIIQHDRRKFFQSLSGLFIGAHLISGSSSPLDDQNKKNLWDEFTDEEKISLQSSVMAADILDYPKQGFSCAGSILTCSLAFLGRYDEISHVASSFGGGIGRSDLCGLLTGGHMAIGVSAGMIHKDVKERQKYAREISNKYWDWWKSMAPIHCSELKPQYDREGYARMIQRVALKIEELIKPALLQ